MMMKTLCYVVATEGLFGRLFSTVWWLTTGLRREESASEKRYITLRQYAYKV